MRVSRGDATFRAQASWEGNGELVQAFLDAEPEAVNAVDRSPFGGGYNALMYAAYAGHLELCQLLLRHGADVSAENDEGCSALFLAAQQGRADVVAQLLEHGADASATVGNHGLCAVDAARGYEDVLAVIREFGPWGPPTQAPPPRLVRPGVHLADNADASDPQAHSKAKIDVQWDPPRLSRGELPIQHVKVRLLEHSDVESTGGPEQPPARLVVASAAQSHVTVRDLRLGTQYVAQIAHVNALGFAPYSDVSEPARTLATADHGAAVTAQADPSSTTPRVRQEPATREEALKPRSFISRARTRCEEARETRKKREELCRAFQTTGTPARPPVPVE